MDKNTSYRKSSPSVAIHMINILSKHPSKSAKGRKKKILIHFYFQNSISCDIILKKSPLYSYIRCALKSGSPRNDYYGEHLSGVGATFHYSDTSSIFLKFIEKCARIKSTWTNLQISFRWTFDFHRDRGVYRI